MTTWILGALVAAGIVMTDASEPVEAPEIEQVASAPQLVVLQRNVDGNKARFDNTVQAAKDQGAHAVILQEVCESWMAELPSTWRRNYATTKPKATNHCSTGTQNKGVVAIWTRPVTSASAQTWALESDIGRTPKLACLSVASGGAYSVCSTHLVAFNQIGDQTQDAQAIRRIQTRQIRDHVKDWIPNRRVVLGGDFNTYPSSDAMHRIYALPTGLSEGGRFTEGSQLRGTPNRVLNGRGGAYTVTGRKIDYIFFSQNFVPDNHPGRMDTTAVVEGQHSRLLARVDVDKAIPAAASEPAPAPNPTPTPTCDNDCYRAQLGTQSYDFIPSSSPSQASQNRIVFDRQFYAGAYPDVLPWAQGKVQTQGGNVWDHVQWHWLNYGIPWGRMGSATLDPPYYLSIHPDLTAAFGATNYQAAINHYFTYGQHEGRRGSVFFDVGYYKSRYGDLAGHTAQGAMQHFTHYGMSEGRQGSPDFGPAYYMGIHPDLRNAFGANNYRRGMGHWISNGRAEGRRTTP